MKPRKVIVIGGGPAGLMAAGQAAEAGAETLLLEKMKRTGIKLCITGKGRCNITNIADIFDFISHFGKNGPFLPMQNGETTGCSVPGSCEEASSGRSQAMVEAITVRFAG